MNRLEEIAKKLVKDLENKVEAHPTTALYIDGVEHGCKMLLEAIKPEIELMLKEQAKMVKDAAIGKIENVVDERRENGLNVSGQVALIVAIIQSSLDDLQHDWVKLED